MLAGSQQNLRKINKVFIVWDTGDAGETNTKPNSILNNISRPLYGDILHLIQHPSVQYEGLLVLIRSTHQQNVSFLNGPLVSANGKVLQLAVCTDLK